MLDVLIDHSLQYLALVLSAAVVALTIKALQWFGLQIDANKQAKLEYFAQQGIQKAKEEAARRLKSSAIKLTADDKLQIALAHVTANVPKANPQQAVDTVTAILPALGEGASAPKD